MSNIKHSAYVPALDGLRVFAVVAVMLYHLNFTWAQGGLLGVTVFFVLSGYLITTMLVNELESTRTVRLGRFWWGRIRRLFPAIFTVIGITALLMWAFNHILLTKMKPDIIPSLFWFENWWYVIRDLSYFEAMGSPSPLVHFWSLAIEEQFYLVWPLVLLLVYKIGGKNATGSRRNIVAGLCLVLGIASALWMAFLYDPNIDPTRVYYGTDTRAFSLLFGGFLACICPASRFGANAGAGISHGKHCASAVAAARDASYGNAIGKSATKPNALSICLDIAAVASIAALCYMMFTFAGTDEFMFRGGIALASVLTALIILACTNPRSIFAKILGCRPLAFLGKRTYGMYLWHLPFVLLLYTFADANGQYPAWAVAAVFGLTIGAALLMYVLIEHPLHKGVYVNAAKNADENAAADTNAHINKNISLPSIASGLGSNELTPVGAPELAPAGTSAAAHADATTAGAGTLEAFNTSASDAPAKERSSWKPKLTPVRLALTFSLMAGVFAVAMFLTFTTPDQQYLPDEDMATIGFLTFLNDPEKLGLTEEEMREQMEAGIDALGHDTANYTGSEWTSQFKAELNSKGVYDPYIIGDSVCGAIAFNSVFPHAYNNSVGSRSIYEGVDALQEALDNGVVGRVVVFAAFNNGWIKDGQLESIIEMCGPNREVFFVAPRTPYSTVNNGDSIEAIIPNYSNAHMIDWRNYAADHVDEWCYQDKVHMNATGTAAYLKLVLTSVYPYLDAEDLPSYATQ